MNEKFRNAIRDRYKAKGFTMESLGEAVGFKGPNISAYLSKKKNKDIKVKTLEKIFAKLNLDIEIIDLDEKK